MNEGRIKTTDLLTFYGNPESKIVSEYGTITFLEWCKREVARINKINKNVFVHENEIGSIAIIRKDRGLC